MTLNRATPTTLFGLLEALPERRFIGWAHACRLNTGPPDPPPCNTREWIVHEANSVAMAGRVADGNALKAQAREYAKTLRSNDVYIDSAMFVQRGASPLFTAWPRDMFKDPETDRDQLPFAHVFPQAMQRSEALIVPYDVHSCLAMGVGVCHWWHARPDGPIGVSLTRMSVVGVEDQRFTG